MEAYISNLLISTDFIGQLNRSAYFGSMVAVAVPIGTGLTPKEIEQCKKAFRTYDKNGSAHFLDLCPANISSPCSC